MARGAYQACHELGLKNPGDISLVGFDRIGRLGSSARI